MDYKDIQGYEKVRNKIEEIDRTINIDQVLYDFDTMKYKFFLSRNDKECIVLFPRAFLNDLNDHTGSRDSKYWLALESNLKKRLSIDMQISNLIPYSSDIFFEDNQDWEQNNDQDIEVYFSGNDYKIFHDGLERLYHFLENQKTELSHLKLNRYPYNDDQIYIKNMLLYRNKQITEHGQCDFREEISVTSRKHLKAAALIEFMSLEKETLEGKYSGVVKKEITEKITRILGLLSLPVFERIEVAEYLYDFRDTSKSAQYKSMESDNVMLKEYDVVISFAGEDRGYAEKIADLLLNDKFRVFYDKYEEYNLWGKDLYSHLSEVYNKCGRYCVMFLSENYAKKQWPTLERKNAQARAFKENREYILPIRIDDTEIPGIPDTVGYQDLRLKTIEEIYSSLKQKLLSQN